LKESLCIRLQNKNN